MPRNMSFALTIDQFRARIKTVTRRCGWWFLKPGDLVWGVEKAMGLKKGEKINRIWLIRIVSTRPEFLRDITDADVVLEGFPEMDASDFIDFFLKESNPKDGVLTPVNRIKFSYILNPEQVLRGK